MALLVKDRLYVQVNISGVEIPLDQLNLLSYLHITESVRLHLPMLTLKLIDSTKVIAQKNLLTDGAIIKVAFGIESVRKAYEFRVFNFTDTLGDGGTEYTISAYLNVPRWWAASSFRVSTETSASNILSQIASFCGLTFEGPATSEKQVWLPRNLRYCEWAREVVEHAWLNDQSCLQVVVLADKRLRMVNVAEPRSIQEVFSNRGAAGEVKPIFDYNVLSKGGFFNSIGGYQDSRIVQSLVSETDVDLANVNVRRTSRKLNMNEAVKGELEQSRVTFAPIDVGNVSENFEKARYQNRRLSNLYNFGAEFATNQMVETDVLDYVTCDFSKPGLNGLKAISGSFCLLSKVTYIEGLNFYQKCEVFRHGMNTSNDTTQV